MIVYFTVNNAVKMNFNTRFDKLRLEDVMCDVTVCFVDTWCSGHHGLNYQTGRQAGFYSQLGVIGHRFIFRRAITVIGKKFASEIGEGEGRGGDYFRRTY